MGAFFKAHFDLLFGDSDLSNGVDEVAEDVLGLCSGIALARRVNCRSQLTFMATAEDKASM